MCKTITLTRSRSSITATYEVKGTPVERVTVIRDLGLLLDSKSPTPLKRNVVPQTQRITRSPI